MLRFLILFLPASAFAAGGFVLSDFETGVDGWTKAPGSDPNSSVQWLETGGNPGGFLRLNEAAQGGIDRIAAPEKFLGNKSSYIGGTFQMDRMTNILSSPLNRNDDIIFIGGGITLRFELPNPGLNEWITETVSLTADAGWINASTSQPPTESEFASVLSNLTAIQLLADFRSGSEQPSYDNILMIPEPSRTAIAVALFAGLWAYRRRQERGPPVDRMNLWRGGLCADRKSEPHDSGPDRSGALHGILRTCGGAASVPTG